MQTRSQANARGVDVSKWQGTIDWAKVKQSGVDFVLLKATEGTTIADPLFAANLQGAKSAGLLVGAYHFFLAQNEQEAMDEHRHFMTVIDDNGGLGMLDIPPALDIEYGGGHAAPPDANDLALVWLRRMEQTAGVKPLVYTYPWFAQTYLPGLGEYPLWLAGYSAHLPDRIGGWERWTFLQVADDGKVPGIGGDVDLDEYDGSVNELMAAFGSYQLSAEDANKLILILQGIYQAGLDPQEAHRLANELRKASGQSTT